MSGNFHEAYAQGDIKPPSARSTGLVFAGVAVVVAVIWRHSPATPWVALCVAAVLTILSIAAPAVLGPVSLVWFRFGLLMHRIMNPIIMFAMFALVFVPAGYIMRLWHDPLRSRRATASSTYWIARKAGAEGAGSMTNQF